MTNRPQSFPEASSSACSFLVLPISYDSDDETLRYLDCLNSLSAPPSVAVILIDNTLRKRGESGPFTGRGRVSVIRPHGNLGYLGGARYGLSRYLQAHVLPDWIVISNVDLLIQNSDFFERLSDLALPGVAAVAPRIRSMLTGRDQNPYLLHRPSALRMHVYKWVFRSRTLLNLTEALAAFAKKLKTHFTRDPGNAGRSNRQSGHDSNFENEHIYAPHGSFLILSKEYFTRGGNLDFPGFLFGEEIYIAETIRRLGLRVVYRPDLEVVHQEHRSTRLFKSRKLAADVAFSAAYCADAFFPLRARDRVIGTE